MRPLSIGVAGLGNVAQGVLALLRENGALIAARAGRPIAVAVVASRRAKDVDLLGADFTTDVGSLVKRNDVDVVVELMGGEDAALSLVESALDAGKPVVTANKAILAAHGDRLFELAARGEVAMGIEASVAGGIPVIAALTRSLVANDIDRVVGIINGTCNFILTGMSSRGERFDAALAQAQELGYAEADPHFDVGGVDAAHKLAILAALAFGVPFSRDAVYTEGITEVTPEDIAYARELGYCIKQLGIARRTPAGIETRVHPTLVPLDNMLASASGVMNAVELHGNATGSVLLHGPGAGGRATASAVLADLVSIARGERPVAYTPAATVPARVAMTDVVTAAYLRIPAIDQPGVFARIATILSEHGISIEGAIQRERAIADRKVPIVVLTQPVPEGEMNRALDALAALPAVVGPIRRIRVEHLDG
ncbi:MAG: homoserine dehydrogenase [Pseudomonadales bacterium]|nr:homoserine dehydrogenase [Pseudomonadales bacterium]MCP5182783.1 homoserine dehydrogenase [Pseudomonadales bacterium]